MNIFMSWSGEESRKLSVLLSDYLRSISPEMSVFNSSSDIDSGVNWLDVIKDEVQKSDVALIVLTKDNINSPWLHFEVGALSSRPSSRVIPLLFGISIAELRGPLQTFQVIQFNSELFSKLLHALHVANPNLLVRFDSKINDSFNREAKQIIKSSALLKESGTEIDAFQDAFEKSWKEATDD